MKSPSATDREAGVGDVEIFLMGGDSEDIQSIEGVMEMESPIGE